MLRILLAPVILVCAALSFPALDAYRRAHAYGWLSPEMEAHWVRLFNRQPGDTRYHAAKNVLSEWVRLDAQRAGKLFSLLILVLLLALALK